jgi:hypothetical protein
MQWRKAWKRHAQSHKLISCPGCGAGFQLEDDGIDAEQGGLVSRKNISKPKIDSINIAGGPRTGGNVAFITGNALDIGDNLVVKVGDKQCATTDQRTQTTARIVLPAATYTLNVEEQCDNLTLHISGGPLVVDEAFTATNGTTGVIRKIEGTTHWVTFANYAGSIVGSTITGSTSGASATVETMTSPTLLVGEIVVGASSAAQGTVRSMHPFVVDSPSNGFAPEELVYGIASKTVVRLSTSPAYSGVVDITVENEYGQRKTGNKLVGAYTYT